MFFSSRRIGSHMVKPHNILEILLVFFFFSIFSTRRFSPLQTLPWTGRITLSGGRIATRGSPGPDRLWTNTACKRTQSCNLLECTKPRASSCRTSGTWTCALTSPSRRSTPLYRYAKNSVSIFANYLCDVFCGKSGRTERLSSVARCTVFYSTADEYS